MTEKDKIKIIFALKVKYFRLQKGLSYQQLRDLTGLSTSYLHDIEKGSKYPKIDKITALAAAFGIGYDELVSMSGTKKIQPIIDVLNSDFLKIFPVDMFGLDLYKLLDLFSNTPEKVTAFISTIIKITRNYQLQQEHFYQAALRSYQDMFDNYFEELEKAVWQFCSDFDVDDKKQMRIKGLEKLLQKHFDIAVNRTDLAEEQKLGAIRSVYSPQKKILFLNQGLTTAQEKFLLSRELAFQYLKLAERPLETRILDINSFEILYNNFKASYFAAALLMPEDAIIKDIQNIAAQAKWHPRLLLRLLKKYDVTPEMLTQRMTNILPHHFGVRDLFFLRMIRQNGKFRMTKELHLSQLHNPHGNVRDEHYCARWISTNIIRQLDDGLIADAQISQYWQSEKAYLCLSMAKMDQQSDNGVSVTLGFLINDQLKQQLAFLNDPKLTTRLVNITCERCSIADCAERRFAPVVIEEEQAQEERLARLRGLVG